MIKLKVLSPNVKKIIGNGNAYIVEDRILIDTSRAELKEKLKETIESTTPLENIKTVLLTHLHYDHTGNLDLFPNAEVYASDYAVEHLADNAMKRAMILKEDNYIGEKKEVKKLSDAQDMLKLFEITETPGHCKSCIVLYYAKDNILFAGDTYFTETISGRVDLPSSDPEAMPESLKKVRAIIEKHNPTIAAGHDYH